MKCTYVLNLWIKEQHMDIARIAKEAEISEEQLKVTVDKAYVAEDFLKVCSLCNVSPLFIHEMAKKL